MTDLHYLSATEVLDAFRARELSPVEVLDAVSARADATEPTVNCLLERDHEDLTAAARPQPTATPARASPRGPSRDCRWCSRRSSRSPAAACGSARC